LQIDAFNTLIITQVFASLGISSINEEDNLIYLSNNNTLYSSILYLNTSKINIVFCIKVNIGLVSA
jgi:hypothetical protein